MAQMVTPTIVYDDENDVRRTVTLPAEEWDGTYEWVTGVQVPSIAMKYINNPVAPTSTSVLPSARVKKITWTVSGA